MFSKVSTRSKFLKEGKDMVKVLKVALIKGGQTVDGVLTDHGKKQMRGLGRQGLPEFVEWKPVPVLVYSGTAEALKTGAKVANFWVGEQEEKPVSCQHFLDEVVMEGSEGQASTIGGVAEIITAAIAGEETGAILFFCSNQVLEHLEEYLPQAVPKGLDIRTFQSAI